MARPKTEAATYERVTLRMPPVLLAMVRAFVAETGVPLNTALIQFLWSGVETKAPTTDRPRRVLAASSRAERARRAAPPAP